MLFHFFFSQSLHALTWWLANFLIQVVDFRVYSTRKYVWRFRCQEWLNQNIWCFNWWTWLINWYTRIIKHEGKKGAKLSVQMEIPFVQCPKRGNILRTMILLESEFSGRTTRNLVNSSIPSTSLANQSSFSTYPFSQEQICISQVKIYLG